MYMYAKDKYTIFPSSLVKHKYDLQMHHPK
jgi:hypothetical protein